MVESSSLPGLALDDLARQCAQQTDRYRRRLDHDSRYCLEIVRRAVRLRDEKAWAIFEDQSRSQVASWVRRHPGYDECGEDVDVLINFTFEKLWLTFSADQSKLDRFTNYQGWMKYLQMCVHSVIVDTLRYGRRWSEISEDLTAPPQESSTSAHDLWEYVSSQLKDEKERWVMAAFLLYGTEPQDLYRQFPSRFDTVKEIYRIRQNVIARLRRDSRFRELFGPDD